MSVNKVILVGNLGRDPEVRYTPEGTAICNLSLATSQRRTNRTTGEVIEDTEWHRISMFDRLAEIAGEYLNKGSKIYVEGRLRTRNYQDKSGENRYITEIVAQRMQMLSSKNSDSAPSGNAQRGKPPPLDTTQSLSDLDDDIPF